MAGDWLKIEAATPDKPEVFEIAVQLNIQPAEAFGRLFLVWRWFDQHTENGNAVNVTSAYLDHIAGVTGFANAMRNVGWLSGGAQGEMGIALPHFDYHNGKTAKARALTAKRVATHKIRNGNGALTQNALPREEKRRSTPVVPALFARFWEVYPSKASRGRAEKAWRKLNPNEQLTEKILQAVERAKTSEKWQKNSGKFIPYPATWLNDKGWEDKPLEKPQRGFVV